MSRILTILAVLAIMGSASRSYADPASAPAAVRPLYEDMGFEQHQVTDALGRRVTYYLAHSTKPAPILLAIQGSGCDQLFPTARNDRGVYDSWATVVRSAVGDRFTVLAVEKPFAQPRQASPRMGEACGRSFNADFSADRWLVALRAALKDAEASPWVAKGGVFVLGHSEGAPMAALVASHDAEVTGLAYFAGPGDTQVYDALLAAYERGKSPTEQVESLEKTEAQIKIILSHPVDTNHFAWGHTFLRWSSFYKLSTLDDLRQSKARVYLASATADQNVPFWSTQIAAARLLADGRDFHNRILPEGDHSFRRPEDKDSSGLAAEYRRALDWLSPP